MQKQCRRNATIPLRYSSLPPFFSPYIVSTSNYVQSNPVQSTVSTLHYAPKRDALFITCKTLLNILVCNHNILNFLFTIHCYIVVQLRLLICNMSYTHLLPCRLRTTFYHHTKTMLCRTQRPCQTKLSTTLIITKCFPIIPLHSAMQPTLLVFQPSSTFYNTVIYTATTTNRIFTSPPHGHVSTNTRPHLRVSSF